MQALSIVLHGSFKALLDLPEDILDLPGPPHLVSGQADHALVLKHPFHPGIRRAYERCRVKHVISVSFECRKIQFRGKNALISLVI